MDAMYLMGRIVHTRDQQIETMTQRIADLTALLRVKDLEIARLQAESRDYIRALESRVQHLNSGIDRLKALV